MREIDSPELPPRLEPHFSRNFLAKVAQPAGFEVLFDHLPDVYFFVKDDRGRFVSCNQAFLGLVGRSRESEVIGFQDSDFFPPALAENYMNDDRVVLRSGEPILNRVELMRNPDGSIDWYTTTKLPLLDRNGTTIGVAGITRDVKKMNSTAAHFLSWAPVLEAMLSDYAEPHSALDLASKIGLSVSQFNRQFKKKFHTTPRNYLSAVRMNAACHCWSRRICRFLKLRCRPASTIRAILAISSYAIAAWRHRSIAANIRPMWHR